MFTDFVYRIRALVRRGKLEEDLDAELRFHLDMEADKHLRAGHTRLESARRARIGLGGFERTKEDARDSWGVCTLHSTLRDVRYALRVLRKSPGFTVAVTLSLALGIGANTAIFTLVDAVMWRMLPVDSPENLLVLARQEGPRLESGFTYQQFRVLRETGTSTTVAGYAASPINVSIDGAPEPSVQGQLVSGHYFNLLGVRPVVGRAIGPEDDRVPDGHPVAMLSYGYWERRFGRDPGVVGRTIRLAGAPFSIVGVTPAGFFGVEIGTSPAIFVPLSMQPTVMPAFENLLDNPINSRTWVHTLARLKSGVSREQAAAALDAVFQSAAAQPGRDGRSGTIAPPVRIVLAPASSLSALRQQLSRPLFVLFVVVGSVLAIACANTANLLLARATARRPELAMRLALGASRSRLVRQLLIESVVLASLGGACGILLARWTTQLLVVFMSSGRTPITLELAPDVRILAFTAAVSMLTGIGFGLLPAWRATRLDVAPVVSTGRGSVTRRARIDRWLSVAQLAMSLVLLVAAGLFLRSLSNLNGDAATPVSESVLTLRVEPKGSDQRGVAGTLERLDRTYRDLIQRTRAIPGVRLASMAQITPTAPDPGAAPPVRTRSGELVRVPLVMVYPDYFATMGISLVRGREFDTSDLRDTAPAVCIVNEAFVREFLGGREPLGNPCFTGRRPLLAAARASSSVPAERPVEPYVIVGVVKDSRYSNPRGAVRPTIYGTFLQTNTGRGQMVLHVRAAGDPHATAGRIREQVVAVDPAMTMFDVRTLEEEMNAALVQHRLLALLTGCFGALALTLACVGLYGLLSYSVVQRRSELGIRLALGATASHLLRMIVSEAMVLVVAGMAIGGVAAVMLAKLAASQVSGLLFGVEATDAATLVGATIALAGVAALASYLPARRASRVDPIVALRSE